MEAGRNFLHFLILRQLGRGGMGEVYLAEDQKLGRKVALKFLPQEFSRNEERLRRFEQEARAASALNHPNIMTVFEVGQLDGHHFIASEFVDGETLRDRIAKSSSLTAKHAVDIAIQVSAALSAAHAAGIVHRDIKPENIMIRHDGYVKVLDFGLAKRNDPEAPKTNVSTLPTKAPAHTEPGTVLGTVQYMSPEQARGLDLDSRTDLFSLGIILYEMIAGRMPFEGATRSDVIVSILNKEAPQLSTQDSPVPEELEWIVRKALRKDRDERYQTAKEMIGDLKALQQRPDFRNGSDTSPISTGARLSTGPSASHGTESTATKVKSYKALVVAAILGIVALGVFLLNPLRKPTSEVKSKGSEFKISRLTTSGAVGRAAISPDGKMVAYSMQVSGQESLWLKQISTGSNIAVIPPSDVDYLDLAFGPDGSYIYFVKSDGRATNNSLYRVPVLGGSINKVLDGIVSVPAFSPDGRQFAYVSWDESTTRLMTASSDGSSSRMQIEARPPKYIDRKILSWLPDNRIIFSGVTGDTLPHLFSTLVDSGQQTVFLKGTWGDFDGIAAQRDPGEVLITAAHVSTNWFYQIWSISLATGEARRVTKDPNTYLGLSGATDAKSFVTVQNDRLSDIWINPADGAGAAKQVTRERYDGRFGLTWTPDGKIVFANRNFELWLMNADGTGRTLLSAEDRTNRRPLATPDGKYVVFESWRESPRGQTCAIWIMKMDGTDLKWLAPTSCSAVPSCQGDCDWIYYDSDPVIDGIWKVPKGGGTSVQVIKDDASSPALSADGSKIACFLFNQSGSNGPVIAIYPVGGGSPEKIFRDIPNIDPKLLRWTPDGKGLVHIVRQAGVSNLFVQPLDGGPSKQITQFDADEIYYFDISAGGQVAVSRGRVQNDVMLITVDE